MMESQAQELERLRQELSKLNERFDRTKKLLGLPNMEDVLMPDGEVSPELARMLETAKEKAQLAGREAAQATAHSSPLRGRTRRGALTI